jgi:hypothetical protein
MELDPDTVLTAVYVTVDDAYRAQFLADKPVRRGPKPALSDSEVLTLAILAQWQTSHSERAFLRYAQAHWQAYFPRLLDQGQFNRRVRDLWGVLCALGPVVAQRLAAVVGPPAYEVLDGTPVPLARRCRGARHRLFAAAADIGCGGSDRDWYYGVKLVAAIDQHGAVTGFVLAPASTEERWATEALLRWRHDPMASAPTPAQLAPILGPAHRHRGQRVGPTGPIGPRLAVGRPSPSPYVADGGLRGRAWHRHWRQCYGATVLTVADLPTRHARRWLSARRQVVETTFNALTATLGLVFPRARSLWGLHARIGAKIAALDISLYLNHLFHRPLFALPSPWA